MSSDALPQIDSIKELAQFWDVHDLTDFEDQLEDVGGSVFNPQTGSRKNKCRLVGSAAPAEKPFHNW